MANAAKGAAMWGRGAGAITGGTIKVAVLAAVCLAVAVAPAAQGSPHVYVATRGDSIASPGGAIWQFDAGLGALSALSPASVATPDSFHGKGLAIHPYGHSVYRLTDRGVSQLSVQGDGTLVPKTPASLELIQFPLAIAVSPDGGSVYVSYTSDRDGSGSIAQFSVGPDGGLTPRSPARVPAPDGPQLDLAVSPDGRSLYATNRFNGRNTVSRYSIGADGRLTPTLDETATAAEPDGVALSPDGEHLYVANRTSRVVSQYSVAADGTLTPKSPATIGIQDATGSLESLVVAPDGLSLYVAGAAVTTVPGAILQYSIGADGRLTHKTPFAVGPTADARFEDLTISRDGQSLYATNTAGDSVHQFTIGTDGRLAPRVPATVAAGRPSGIVTGPAAAPVQPPVATVTSPAQGSGYFRGQAVTTAFTCADGAGGPGISSCLDEDGDPPGKTIDTSALGTFRFAVLAESANGQVSRSEVTYSVVNRPPTVSDRTITTDEDVDISFVLDAADPDGDTLTASPSSAPDHGTVPCSGLTCTYRPRADFHGTDDFVIRISDGNGGTAFATVTATVRPVNDPPEAATAVLTTDEGVDVSFTLPATHPDGDPLTFDVTQPPTGSGSVTCDGAACTYHADPDYCCTTIIHFTASDPDGERDAGAVWITINPIDDPIRVSDQTVVLDENTSVTFGLDATDPDGEDLFAEVTDHPDHGRASCSGVVCDYTPAPNFVGQDSFSYVVFDEQGEPLEATVTLTVRAVNAPPVARDQPVVTDEDTTRAITLGATDPDGGELTFHPGQPAHGDLSCTTSTACTYAPDTNYNGPDAFEFTVTDDHGDTDTGTVSITVRPVNDAPNAIGQSLSTDEDEDVTFGLDVSDVDGDTLTATLTGAPDSGSVSCAGTVCTYSPDPNAHGEDAFAYVVTDGQGGSAGATVALTTRPVNDPPVADSQSLTTDEDTDLPLTLTGTDPDGDELTVDRSQPAHGGVACNDGGCTYDPDTNFNGPDEFTFTVTDDHGETDTATVSITVRPVNDAPNAIGQSLTTDEDTEITFGLDVSDLDGDALSATVSADPTRGSASCSGTTCTYVPDENLHGQDDFAYVVSDGHGGTATATVFVTVGPVADAPVAEDRAVSVFEDAGVAFTLGATDADGDALTFTPAAPAHGTLDCTGAGCLYRPAANYHGDDTFTFTVFDGNGGTDTGRVDITVQPVNDAPVADDRSVTVAEDGSTTFSIAATDAEGDTLSTEVGGSPSHGTASCDGLSCTYEPAGNYNGSDSFVVVVDDGHGGADTATVSVTVTPANDAPTAQDITVATDEDTGIQLALLGGDIDGDALTYAVAGAGPQHGTVSCSGALCTYTPAADYHGPDSFAYRVTDPSGASAGASVAVTVNSVVDATTLTVPPVIRVRSQPLLKLTIPFEARLVRSPGGQPLAGRTTTFVTGGQRACSAVTNAQGVAKCTATLPSLLGVLLGLGYTAVFDGDTTYAGSSAKGALIA